MRLHFSLIADTIKSRFSIIRHTYGPSSDYSLKLNYPRIYWPGRQTSKLGLGDLLVLDARNLPESAQEFEGSSLICVGSAPAVFREGSCDIIEIAGEPSVYDVLEAIIDLYNDLEYWAERVRDTLVCSEGLSDLFSLYYEQLQNPVFLTNSMHEILVYVEDPQAVPVPDIYHYLNKDADKDDARENLMQDVLLSPMYEDSFQTMGPQLWIDEVFPFDSLYCNIVVDGAFRGRILVDEQVHPFKISDYALLQMLHDDIVALMCRQPLLIDDLHVGIWKHLSDIIEGAAPDHDTIERIKRRAGWQNCKQFECFVVRLLERDLTIGSGHVNCALIEQTAAGCRAFVHNDAIVAIIPFQENEGNPGALPQDLLLVMRDRLMKAGVSNGFSKLEDIKKAYQQAKLALETGERTGSTEWVFYCDDYLLSYMLGNCNGGLNALTLCHSKLQALIDYDAQRNLEYVKTLKSYVENNCSQVETCRELFLHRSTLLQRLKRIEEITRLNLDDKKTRLYLLVYFSLAMQQDQVFLA